MYGLKVNPGDAIIDRISAIRLELMFVERRQADLRLKLAVACQERDRRGGVKPTDVLDDPEHVAQEYFG